MAGLQPWWSIAQGYPKLFWLAPALPVAGSRMPVVCVEPAPVRRPRRMVPR